MPSGVNAPTSFAELGEFHPSIHACAILLWFEDVFAQPKLIEKIGINTSAMTSRRFTACLLQFCIRISNPVCDLGILWSIAFRFRNEKRGSDIWNFNGQVQCRFRGCSIAFTKSKPVNAFAEFAVAFNAARCLPRSF